MKPQNTLRAQLLSLAMCLIFISTGLTAFAHAPTPPGDECSVLATENVTLAMFGVPDQANVYYQPGTAGLKLMHHADGSASMVGEIVNKNNPNQRWQVAFSLINKKSAAAWTAAGNSLMVDDTDACYPVNTSDWEIWEIATNISTFTGMGDFAGRSLTVYNWTWGNVVKRSFVQVGTGAGVISCDKGMGVWLAFQGSHEGSADFFAHLDCSNTPPPPAPTCEVLNTNNVALAMFGVPDQANTYYQPAASGLFITKNADGTATLSGEIVNKSNANQRWMVSFNLMPKQTASAWTAAGNDLMTDPAVGCFPVNTSDWEIWEIVNGSSTFTGMGAFAGRTLSVYNWMWNGVIKRNFIQTGTGAGVITCDLGMGAWLAFQGSHEGSADFYAHLDCGNTPPPPAPTCEVLNTNNVALAMFGVPDQANTYYQPAASGLFITKNADGTATLSGEIVNKSNANQRWMVSFNLMPKQTAAAWTAAGNDLMTDPAVGCFPVNTSDWEIWEIVNGSSTFTGMGAFAGRTLSVYNWMWNGVIKRNFIQTGTGAGVITCDLGMGAWLAFQGSHEGSADFYAHLDCGNTPPPPAPKCEVLNTNNVALAMFGVPDQANLYYQPAASGLFITENADGTATMSGEIVNKSNANQRWMVTFNLMPKQTAAAWTAAGNSLMIDAAAGCFPVNTTDWEIWEIVNGSSTFTGMGAFAGRTLSVYNWTWGSNIKRNFIQTGTGAGVISCDLGMGAWLAFQGSHEGSADFFAQLDCINKKGAKAGTDTDGVAADAASSTGSNNNFEKASANKFGNQNDVIEFVMYPNPADVYAYVYTVESTAEAVSVKVFDTAGRLVASDVVSEGKVRIHTAAMPIGLYFVRMETPGQAPATHVLQVRR